MSDETEAGQEAQEHEAGTEEQAAGVEQQKSEEQPKTVSMEEYNALKSRMQAADKNRSAAEAKLKEIEDAEKSDLERAQNQNEELKNSLQSTQDRLQKTLLENAFFASNKFSWHDPSDALRLADLSQVSIDEDGKVDGMEEAIKALADAKPHLIKQENVQPAPEATGSAHNGKRKGEDTNMVDKDKLARRFPALKK